jgi:hypothetical protein
MKLELAANRHLRLASKPGRAEEAKAALEIFRTTTAKTGVEPLIRVVGAHLERVVAEPDLTMALEVLDAYLANAKPDNFILQQLRGDVNQALGKHREAIADYRASLQALANSHPSIVLIREKIAAAEKAQVDARAAARRTPAVATPASDSSAPGGIQPDSAVRRPGRTSPRATPLVVAPRGTPLQVAPRGTPLVVAPKGTPLGVAPKGTPISLSRKPSDTATTISVEERN